MTLKDVHQLLDEIMQVLNSPLEPTDQDVIDLAAKHDEFVVEVSERLAEVEKLLNRGLRAEAFSIAEHEPNLNDLVVTLDFPELEVWNDLLHSLEVQSVRPLPMDIAEELNEAYAVDQPLEDLLNRYRTQSLARAPLADRITTLRLLAAADGSNPQWKVDVKTFETKRLEHLRADFQQAAAAEDLDRLMDLAKEVSVKTWTVKVPVDLKKKIVTTRNQLTKRNAIKELEPVAHQLSDAYAEFDRPRAAAFRQKFIALTDVADLDPSHELYDIAGPALDWLNEEDARESVETEFEAAKSALETALTGQPDLAELDQLYHQAVRHQHELPEQLERRLADRIELLKSQESRRRTLTLVSVVAASCAVLVGIVFVIRGIAYSRAVEGHVAQMAVLVDDAEKEGSFSAVDNYVQKIEAEDSSYLLQPEILGLTQRLETIREADSGRRSELDALFNRVKSLCRGTVRWEGLQEADEALAAAESLILNTTERAILATVRNQRNAAERTLQKTTDETFAAEQMALVDQIGKLPVDSVSGYQLVLTEISDLENRPHVSAEVKTSLAPLKSKVARQLERVTANLKAARSFVNITDSVGQLRAYQKALLDYCDQFPGQRRSGDFREVAQNDLPVWELVEQWNQLRRRLVKAPLKTVSLLDARTLVANWQTFQKSGHVFPGTTHCEDRIPALQAIANRSNASNGTVSEQIEQVFAPPTISRSWRIKLPDGEQYLLSEPAIVEGSKVTISYFTTTNGTQTQTRSIAKVKAPNEEALRDENSKSPQAIMTSNLKSKLQVMVLKDFEAAIHMGVAEVLSASDVDPILRLQLVEQILTIGSEGSVFVRTQAEPFLEGIAAAGVSRLTNWVMWDDPRARQERRLATAFLLENSDKINTELRKSVTARDEASQWKPGPEWHRVGWLNRDEEGNFVVRLKSEIRTTGQETLYALGRESTNSECQFIPVATISGSSVGVVPVDEPLTIREGCPVYLPLAKGSSL